MTTWFTSDLHLQHRYVAHLRGYGPDRDHADVAAHDAEILDHWRATVRPDDILWILGDLALTNILPVLCPLPGRKRLILGNHDPAHPMHSRAPKAFRDHLEVFEYVAMAARAQLPTGRKVLLSHFPYDGDHEGIEPRYTQWRLRDEGQWLLHGHTHGPERVHGHEIHIGWDAWRRFVSAEEIAKLIEHHTTNTGMKEQLT